MWAEPPPAPICENVFYQAAYLQDQTFDEVFEHIIDVEGSAYVNHKGDLPSKFGITPGAYAQFLGKKSVSLETIKSLKLEDARKFYKKTFWHGLGLNRLKSPALAVILTDQFIHRGQYGGVVFLQNFLNQVRPGSLTVSVILTQQTVDLINEMDETEFIVGFFKYIQRDYLRIAAKNPDKRKFLAGWFERSYKVLKLAYPKELGNRQP